MKPAPTQSVGARKPWLQSAGISSLEAARDSLARAEPRAARADLEQAAVALQELASALGQTYPFLDGADRESAAAALRLLTSELAAVKSLIDQGEAVCREWHDILQPPPGYGADGKLQSNARGAAEVSLQG
jgi:hypothetical protein